MKNCTNILQKKKKNRIFLLFFENYILCKIHIKYKKIVFER